jgi:hypothetical protein
MLKMHAAIGTKQLNLALNQQPFFLKIVPVQTKE